MLEEGERTGNGAFTFLCEEYTYFSGAFFVFLQFSTPVELIKYYKKVNIVLKSDKCFMCGSFCGTLL